MEKLRFNKGVIATVINLFLLLSVQSYAQQDSIFQNRVAVLVSVKEIKPTVEIIQLPADNVDIKLFKTARKVQNAKSSMAVYNAQKSAKAAPIAKSNNTVIRETKKETALTKNQIVNNSKPNTVIQKNTKPTVVQQSEKKAQVVNSSNQTQQLPAKQETAQNAIVANNTVANNNATSNTTNSANSQQTKTLRDNSDSADILAQSNIDTSKSANSELDNHIQKSNNFRYTWVGIFLILTGIVFGLLFGKIAFLISVVGVVFIIIGYLIH